MSCFSLIHNRSNFSIISWTCALLREPGDTLCCRNSLSCVLFLQDGADCQHASVVLSVIFFFSSIVISFVFSALSFALTTNTTNYHKILGWIEQFDQGRQAGRLQQTPCMNKASSSSPNIHCPCWHGSNHLTAAGKPRDCTRLYFPFWHCLGFLTECT